MLRFKYTSGVAVFASLCLHLAGVWALDHFSGSDQRSANHARVNVTIYDSSTQESTSSTAFNAAPGSASSADNQEQGLDTVAGDAKTKSAAKMAAQQHHSEQWVDSPKSQSQVAINKTPHLSDRANPEEIVFDDKSQSEEETKKSDSLLSDSQVLDETSAQPTDQRSSTLDEPAVRSPVELGARAETVVASAGAPPSYQLGSIQAPKPKYPYIAFKRGWQGKVLLGVDVQSDGRPERVAVLESSGFAVLDNAARDTILDRWVFKPALRFEQAVAGYAEVPIAFQIN